MKLPPVVMLAAAVAAAVPQAVDAAAKPRARELGLVPLIGGTAGTLDAITDVPGVEVGHTTLVSGEGRLVPGGADGVRVTALPHDRLLAALRKYGRIR